MAKHKKRSRRHTERHSIGKEVDFSLERTLERADYLLHQDCFEQALQLLEDIPDRYQRHPEVVMQRGLIYMALGDAFNAINNLEHYLMRRSKDTEVYLLLAVNYAELGWAAHALRSARRYLRVGRGNTEQKTVLRRMLADLEPEVMELHEVYGVPENRCVEAGCYNEEAMRLMHQMKFTQALTMCKKAIRVAPQWPAPYNNRVAILSLTGHVDEAIEQSLAILDAIQPGNLFTTATLVRLYALLDDRESAQPYLEHLRGVKLEQLNESTLNKYIEALAYWDDAETLWRVAEWALTQEFLVITPHSWYALGVAAIETEHLQAARACFQEVGPLFGRKNEKFSKILSALDAALMSQPLCLPTLSGHLSCISPAIIMQGVPLDELIALLKSREDAGDWTPDLLKKRDIFLKRYPQFELGAIKMFQEIGLDEEDALDTYVSLLLASGTERAYKVLEAFALSHTGSNAIRTQVFHRLMEAGWLKRGHQVKFWDADTQIERDVTLTAFAIKDLDVSPYSDAVLDLLDAALEALHSEEDSEALQLYHKALDLDPHCGLAAYNIGVIELEQQNLAEGRAWIERAIAVEPEYLNAYAALANLLIDEGRIDEALKVLSAFLQASEVPPEAYIAYQSASIRIALQKNEWDQAKRLIEDLEKLFPDSPAVEYWKVRLQEMIIARNLRETLGEEGVRYFHDRWLDGVHRHHNRLMKKTISPEDDLRTSLNRWTKEHGLVPMARRLGLTTQARKAELIELIATQLLRPEVVREIVAELGDQARKALQVLLVRGGVMPWAEFTAAFGDDFDESPYWNYHAPETIPALLKLAGLLVVGTHKKERIAVIPHDLRPLLVDALAKYDR